MHLGFRVSLSLSLPPSLSKNLLFRVSVFLSAHTGVRARVCVCVCVCVFVSCVCVFVVCVCVCVCV